MLWRTKILGFAKLHIPNRRITFIDGFTTKQNADVPFTSIVFELTKGSPFGSCIVEMKKEINNEYCVFDIPVRGKQ